MINLHIAITRKHLYAALGILLALAVLIPVGVWAADRFTDVPDSNVFHDDIAWLADAGITKGCNPPSNTEFCPDDFVTRGQMAAFQNRFAGFLGAQDGVVSQADDANTLDGIDSSGFVASGQVLYAAVAADGELHPEASNADSAARIGTGFYRVFFERSTGGCVGTASPGISVPFPAGWTAGTPGNLTTEITTNDPSVTVRTKAADTGNPADTAFHLIVVCHGG